MIHASVELLDAMRGECVESRYLHEFRRLYLPACDADGIRDDCMQATGGSPDNPSGEGVRREVTCPACLRLMREATDPVRWDALEERGLAPKLPLISGAA